ncbi:oligosaccharide flippase family protein [Globicatella sanguinis]|uniref:oligosaccharide flippase family protein n=1 Tax=Globicatella sanguinis TaxID=13076 RepID=UPI002543AF0F|nr:oligosaccharide flippase family protein [Globicatella sanguinis]MDK7631231.1 oligosaccharide flippase family protein [Globicatella sanguinis]WIK66135.1 oligosaccharide flippase family protein [Globicatella sanguinis]WKT55540.1 oligosaccharide flippase family protein [Globicatella sanguinis]
MKKQNSLKLNSVYNFLYSGINIVYPLIVAPYVSRVLGATNLGKVNFSSNLAEWFIILSIFGTNIYGVREISRSRDDRNKLSKTFSELISIKLIMAFLSCILIFISIFYIEFFHEENVLHKIVMMNVFLSVLNVDWFFQGLEEYHYITIRSLIIKTFTILLIFLFVKNRDDYTRYALLNMLSISGNGILNYLHSRKFVKISFNNMTLKKHIKPLFTFFVTNFIINIYASVDSTILGFLSTINNVAFITRSKTIVRSAATVADSISGATMSRAAYYSDLNKEQFYLLQSKVQKMILWISISLMFGIASLSKELMYLLGSVEYSYFSSLVILSSPVVIFSPLSAYLQRQILVPLGLEKEGLRASIFSSFVSLILNILMIKVYGVYGAAITLSISEFLAFFIRYLIINIKYKLKIYLFDIIVLRFLSVGILMFIVIILLKRILMFSVLIEFLICVIVGIICYVGILLFFKDKTTMEIFKFIKSIIYKFLPLKK